MKTNNETEHTPSLDELLKRAELTTDDSASAPDGEHPVAEPQPAPDPRAEKIAARRREDARYYSEREERARRAFKHLTDIDDEGDATMSLRSILGGDILGGRRFRRQIWYVLMLSVLAVIYVSNRYACQREEIRREDLSRQLADRKFKALTAAAELTEYSMRSNVEENLSDSTLQTSTQSSYYLSVDAEGDE